MGTALTTVKPPKDVDIPEGSFLNCTNLRAIRFDATQTGRVMIGSQAFYNVDSRCEAFMNRILVNDAGFKLPRSATVNIPKYAY